LCNPRQRQRGDKAIPGAGDRGRHSAHKSFLIDKDARRRRLCRREGIFKNLRRGVAVFVEIKTAESSEERFPWHNFDNLASCEKIIRRVGKKLQSTKPDLHKFVPESEAKKNLPQSPRGARRR
jgi:hypothetical protein